MLHASLQGQGMGNGMTAANQGALGSFPNPEGPSLLSTSKLKEQHMTETDCMHLRRRDTCPRGLCLADRSTGGCSTVLCAASESPHAWAKMNSSLVHFAWMSMKPRKVKLLAGEQKATEYRPRVVKEDCVTSCQWVEFASTQFQSEAQ